MDGWMDGWMDGFYFFTDGSLVTGERKAVVA